MAPKYTPADEPNRNDPLAEPTPGRRMWAAYLAAGYNRQRWASALGLSYVAASNLDKGTSEPSLSTLMRASELTGYSLDQLAFGHFRQHPRRETELGKEAIKLLLQELRADADSIEALGEFERSAAGQFQLFTRSYVAAFVERYSLARREGMERRPAIDAAKTSAANARANADTVALRLGPPPSAAELAKLGHALQPEAERPKRRKKRPA